MELEIELDDAREVMYDEVVDKLDEEKVDTTLAIAVSDKLTQLYDNLDELEE